MTIQEAGKYATDQLHKIYESSEAAAISSWLIEHLTDTRRTERHYSGEKSLSASQLTQMHLYLQRLLQHEPLQYVLNEAWFAGLKFYVDKNVLIPRPETEELVEWVISNCKFPVDKLSILDVGSGSGCIPIALKKRLSKSVVSGIDISKGALEVAMRNSRELGIDVTFLELDFLDKGKIDLLGSYDIIISNPPYIPESDMNEMQSNVVNYEPHTALFVPNNDPLLFYKAIADFGKEHLLPGGSIYLEIHEKLGEAVTELFKSKGYNTSIKKDMQEKERMVRAIL